MLTGTYLLSPISYLYDNTFLHLLLRSSSEIRLESIAVLMALIAASIFSGNKSTSFPACKALTSTSPFLLFPITPFISNASVKIKPLNPSSFLSKSVTIVLESVEGVFFILSKEGIYKWATIIPFNPFFISSLKG